MARTLHRSRLPTTVSPPLPKSALPPLLPLPLLPLDPTPAPLPIRSSGLASGTSLDAATAIKHTALTAPPPAALASRTSQSAVNSSFAMVFWCNCNPKDF